MQPGPLRLVHSHDHFAAHIVGHALPFTKLDEPLAALAAVDGFERAGRVIDAGMDDA